MRKNKILLLSNCKIYKKSKTFTSANDNPVEM